MIKRILSVLIVIALLVAPLTARPGRASATVFVTNVTATPPTIGAIDVDISITFTTTVALSAGQAIAVTFYHHTVSSGPKAVLVDSGAYAAFATALGSTVTVTMPTGLPAGLHVVLFSGTTGITNPASATTAWVGINTSAEGTVVFGQVSITSGSAVTGVTALTPIPNTVGSAASYQLYFNTSSSGALSAAQFIYLTFPTGTTIPTTLAASTVNVNGTLTTASRVGTSMQIQIVVPVLSTPIANNGSVYVYIQSTSGILNSTVGGTYSLYVSSTADTVSVASTTFPLAGSSISNLTVTVDPLTPSSVAQFTINFNTSSYPGTGTGVKSGDTIRLEFPTGTQFPSGSFCPACFVINGQLAQTAPTRINNVVTITVPTTLSTATPFVYLTISTTAGIINPSTSGSYSLKVSTSLDTTQVTSSQYTLVGTSVSSLAVVANPTAQSAYPELRFSFTTSSSGALTTSDYVYIQFPTAMTTPSSVPAASVTVNGIQASSVSRDGSGKLSVRVPVSIGNSQQVNVVIAGTSGIRNPSTVGTTLSFDVSTSEDVGIRTVSYTTTTSQVSQPQVSLTTNGVGKPSGYTVTFQTGAGGLLSAGTGRIYIVFPNGTTVPASVAGQNVRVNGAAVSNVISSPSNRRVEITTPVAVLASSQVTVVIDAAANIVNPSTPATSYTLAVYTSAEQTLVYSAQYAIVNLPASVAVTIPVAADGLNGYYRTRPAVSITASSPSGYPVSIYYRINTGADTLYGGPVQIPDGTVTFTYYAKDSQNNQEQAKQLTFKVDATAPIITILSPQEGSVTSSGALPITGRTEAGASVSINGTSVAVQPSGEFGGSVPLSEGANAVQIIATDVAGNVGQTRLNVTLDTKPPVLTVTSPKIYATVMTQQVAVTGKTEAGATVTVAGAQVSVAADGSFSIMYMFPKEGLNVIEVTSADAAGNRTKTGIPVTYVARTLIRLQVGNKTAMINDASKTLQAAPINVKGTVMVPIRFIGEAFGATVEWEPTFKIVRLQLSSTTIYLQVGSNYASVNGKKIMLQGLPSIISGTTMVPIRFISEAFNAEVVWNAPTQGIDITYPKP